MPRKGEGDPIARIPYKAYCPGSGETCPMYDYSIVPTMPMESRNVITMLMAGMRGQYSQNSEEQNEILGQQLSMLRNLIVNKHKLADSHVVHRYLCTTHWKATQLALGNLGLVPYAFLEQTPGVASLGIEEAKDVLEVGFFELYQAALRFNPQEFQAKFSTYAVKSIIGKMSQEIIRLNGGISKSALERYILYMQGAEHYFSRYHRSLSHEELVMALREQARNDDWPTINEIEYRLSQLSDNPEDQERRKFRTLKTHYARIVVLVSPVSMDIPRELMVRDNSGDWTVEPLDIGETVADTEIPSVEEAVFLKSQSVALWEELQRLAQRQPRVAQTLRLRFGLDDGIERSYDRVGRELGVTAEAIRVRIENGLRTLRHPSVKQRIG